MNTTETNKSKMLKITLSLSKDGFSWMTDEWNCEEKKITFKLTRKDDKGDDIVRIFDKKSIFSLYTGIQNDSGHIQWCILTFPEAEAEAKEKLMEKVIKNAEYLKAQIDSLMQHIK